MNEIEKQLLKNQLEIMKAIKWRIHKFDSDREGIRDRTKETLNLLNPNGAEEDCCEMDAQELLDDFAKRGLRE